METIEIKKRTRLTQMVIMKPNGEVEIETWGVRFIEENEEIKSAVAPIPYKYMTKHRQEINDGCLVYGIYYEETYTCYEKSCE